MLAGEEEGGGAAVTGSFGGRAGTAAWFPICFAARKKARFLEILPTEETEERSTKNETKKTKCSSKPDLAIFFFLGMKQVHRM